MPTSRRSRSTPSQRVMNVMKKFIPSSLIALARTPVLKARSTRRNSKNRKNSKTRRNS